MKKILFRAALLLTLFAYPNSSRAQKVVIDEPNSIFFISSEQGNGTIINIMNNREQMRFHDPKAPRFLLTDQKGKFALGLGGYVRTTAEYDWNGIARNIDFYPALISQGDKADFARRQFQMDATTSTLFLKLVGHTRHLGDFVVYTAGNFRGTGRAFKLHNAYIQFLGFTIGYNYGLFTDAAALPPTIDFAGPNGSVFYRTTQLSYVFDKVKHWKIGVSMEMPQINATTDSYTAVNTQRIPDFALSAGYSWNGGNHVKLGGILRNLTYQNRVSEKACNLTGFGVQASTTFHLTPQLQMYGQLNYGRGIGSFLGDISCLNADAVPHPQEEGKMQTLPMLGWYASAQYNFCPALFVSATYSPCRLYSENGYPSTQPLAYRKGQYLATNAFCNINSNLQVGVEYLRGWRADFQYRTRHANRINLLVQYSF